MKREREEEAVESADTKLPRTYRPKTVCVSCEQDIATDDKEYCENPFCYNVCCKECVDKPKNDLWVRVRDFQACLECFEEMRDWYSQIPDVTDAIYNTTPSSLFSMVLETKSNGHLLWEFKHFLSEVKRATCAETENKLIDIARHLATTPHAAEMRTAVGRKRGTLKRLYRAIFEDK